ncbi:MAG TPA: DUF167 domain-containing protein [Bryobacteraceae bacterium]|jgi:uncharacterized protein (TIGR00251 family)|nr:DUF167 domain-containing protein [Bryobacteraceae bacterium]
MMQGGRARLRLKIRAGAIKTAFAGRVGEVWKLKVAAPPVDGKANEAIIRFLAKLTGRPAGAIRIVTGFTSPMKTVEIEGVEARELDRAILESHGSETHTGSAEAE